MKKTTKTNKLALRTEHVARLSTLVTADLARAAGGSRDTQCENPVSKEPNVTCKPK